MVKGEGEVIVTGSVVWRERLLCLGVGNGGGGAGGDVVRGGIGGDRELVV